MSASLVVQSFPVCCAAAFINGPKQLIAASVSKKPTEWLALVPYEFENVACELVIPGLWAVWVEAYPASSTWPEPPYFYTKLGVTSTPSPEYGRSETLFREPEPHEQVQLCITTSLQRGMAERLQRAGWVPVVSWHRKKGSYPAPRDLTLWKRGEVGEKKEVRLAA